MAVIKYISALYSRLLVVYWALECADCWEVAVSPTGSVSMECLL